LLPQPPCGGCRISPVSRGGEAGFFHFWRLEVGRPNEAGSNTNCLTVDTEGLISTCHIRHFKASEALDFNPSYPSPSKVSGSWGLFSLTPASPAPGSVAVPAEVVHSQIYSVDVLGCDGPTGGRFPAQAGSSSAPCRTAVVWAQRPIHVRSQQPPRGDCA